MSLTKTLNYFLDFLAPRQNKNYTSIHSYLNQEEIMDIQRKAPPKISSDFLNLFDGLIVCGNYKNPLLADLIFRCKFFGELAIVDSLVDLICLSIEKLTIADAITFVPKDDKRSGERGYHLPELIAKKLGKRLNLKVLNLLEKTLNTPAQTNLSKKQRLHNLRKAFKVSDNGAKILKNYPGGKFWLIDDVITTGATLGACVETLKKFYKNLVIQPLVICG